MNIDFIKEKWSSKYIFDEKFKYINDETDVILKCPIHGYFKINPKMLEYSDVNEDLCRKCYRELHKNIKYTQEEFLEIANKYYGDKYVFDDKCVYINQYHNVTIYCKKHKEYFETYPSSIINHNVKHLCHKCNEEEGFVYKYDKEKYIKKCKELYPNSTIIYDDIVFNTLREYITVKCPIHGEFVINAYYNLYYGCECPKCKEERKNKELLKDFVNKLIIAQPNIDSSKVSGPYFKDGMKHTKENAYYEIWCEEHGYQLATSKYLLNNGCPRCEKKGSIVHRDYTNEEFINEIHKCYGDLYDTSLVEYVNWKTKVKLICPIHGEFYREPFRLIKEKRGCPYCNTIFLLEVEIEDYLKKYNI